LLYSHNTLAKLTSISGETITMWRSKQVTLYCQVIKNLTDTLSFLLQDTFGVSFKGLKVYNKNETKQTNNKSDYQCINATSQSDL